MMHAKLKFFWAALSGALMTVLFSPSAEAYQSAPLNFCNNTAAMWVLRVGYHSPGVNDSANVLTGPFVSRGWWLVAAGACQTFDNPFAARYMFWFATGKGYNDKERPPSDWPANAINTPNDFCVNDYLERYYQNKPIPAFVFEAENASIDACKPPGKSDYIWVTPKIVDTWVSPNVSFTGQ